jgi:hypothetical protein
MVRRVCDLIAEVKALLVGIAGGRARSAWSLVMVLAGAAYLLCLPIRAKAQERGEAKNEVQLESGDSVGNFHLFAYAENRRLHYIGIEYDRHAFGRLFGAQFDYVTELMPVILVNEPAAYGPDSRALTTARQEKYGVGYCPMGLRLLWRKPGQWRPYWMGKGGILYFKDRILSSQGTHMNFSAEFSIGVEKRLTSRMGFRAGFSDFHFSNGNIARKNPGIDFMYFNGGVNYRF